MKLTLKMTLYHHNIINLIENESSSIYLTKEIIIKKLNRFSKNLSKFRVLLYEYHTRSRRQPIVYCR